MPREIEFVDELPTASNGTILRNELRAWTVAAEGVWSTAPRLPGTPAPVTTFEPPPEPRRQAAPAVEEEEPLPDFVVHPSQTYATSLLDLEDEPDVDLDPDGELPDYIVVPGLVPEPLPEHVVEFLNAPPLPEVPIEPEPEREPRPEPRTVARSCSRRRRHVPSLRRRRRLCPAPAPPEPVRGRAGAAGEAEAAHEADPGSEPAARAEAPPAASTPAPPAADSDAPAPSRAGARRGRERAGTCSPRCRRPPRPLPGA